MKTDEEDDSLPNDGWKLKPWQKYLLGVVGMLAALWIIWRTGLLIPLGLLGLWMAVLDLKK